jgi:hypothetical protein
LGKKSTYSTAWLHTSRRIGVLEHHALRKLALGIFVKERVAMHVWRATKKLSTVSSFNNFGSVSATSLPDCHLHFSLFKFLLYIWACEFLITF